MDNIDLTILNHLQEDARKPLSEISNKIHLSLPAVSERLKKLERSDIIKQYTAILDPDKFDKNLCCFCFVTLKDKNPHSDKKFFDFINSEPDIMECHCISGEYEYVLKIRTNSPKTHEELLVRIRNETHVMRTSSFIVLSTIKENPSVPPLPKHNG